MFKEFSIFEIVNNAKTKYRDYLREFSKIKRGWKKGWNLKKKSPNILKFNKLGDMLVIGKGFEPLTHSLEGCCSIQLSYPTYLNCFLSKAMQKYIFSGLLPKINAFFLKKH